MGPSDIVQDIDGDASGRGAPRDSLFLLAELRHLGRPESHEVRVRNLSAEGLMAEFSEPVAIGDAVEMKLRGIGTVGGRVAWATEGRIGVALDRTIDPKKARKPVVSR